MSRVAKRPIAIPKGVEVNIKNDVITVRGKKGQLSQEIKNGVEVVQEGDMLKFLPKDGIDNSEAFAGTLRALVNNMLVGLQQGFERKLLLVGVGYRAQVQGKKLNLTLGYSHPINYLIPEDITIETPSLTEVIVKGSNKRIVGKVAAEIRAFRSPEPYKGKGVRYADERIVQKEGKKK